MASLTLDHVSVRIPVFGPDSWSLKKALLTASTGGKIGFGTTGVLEVQALNNVSFELKPGDRLGLYGPNGSGKTTLLRVMAGIYAPYSGTVHSEGEITSILDLALGVDPTATGYENARLSAMLMGRTQAEIDQMMPYVEEFSELGDYLKLPVKTYSSGMTMRLAFAVATAFGADILLMDEWIAVGDAKFVKKAEARLAEMVESTKIMVLASHSRDTLKRWCNRFVCLEKGRVTAITDELPDEA